ncbi:transposase family protein [Trichormus azollae]|uniref:transposase family protein n=1 Tax=Trichormus azollae TaxID=1164 RepID=UPI00325E810B
MILLLFINNRKNLDAKQIFSVDKAYIREEFITTPYKKPKKSEPSEIQKEENKKLSSRGISVEHLIRRVKTFRVASDRFPLARHCYYQVIMAVCGLVRLELN